MPRIRLIHWNAAEAEERAAKLRASGYDVDYAPLDGIASLRQLRESLPDAVVVDLSRLPSHGREVALALRMTKATRHLPLVFVEGEPEKVAGIQKHLPDAVYTTWGRFRSALKQALAHPPANPVVPKSALDGYAGTPLPKKLGVKAGSKVALVDAPPDFEQTLGNLPEGASFVKPADGTADVTVWFLRSRRDLERDLPRMLGRADKGGLWIAWPKKASGFDSDLTQAVVRERALAAGLVDFKIGALDATWSGLRFTRRRPK